MNPFDDYEVEAIDKIRTLVQTWGTDRIGSYGTSAGGPDIIKVGLCEPHPDQEGMFRYRSMAVTVNDLAVIVDLLDDLAQILGNPDPVAEAKPCVPVDCPPMTEFTWNVPASAKTIREVLGVNPTREEAEAWGAVFDRHGNRWEYDSEGPDWSIRHDDGSYGDPESWTRVNEFGPLTLIPGYTPKENP